MLHRLFLGMAVLALMAGYLSCSSGDPTSEGSATTVGSTTKTTTVGSTTKTTPVGSTTKTTESSSAPQEPVLPLGTVRIGDFTAALSSVERKDAVTNLTFSVTKVKNTGSAISMIAVILTDDHGGKYQGTINVLPQSAPSDIASLLPERFTYVATAAVTIPKMAPIATIKLGERETPYGSVNLAQPKFMDSFGDFAINKNQSIPLGKWLSFALGQANPGLPTWQFPVTIGNNDYSPLPVEVSMGVQNRDGTVSWGVPLSKDVPAMSKTTLNLPWAFEGTCPDPRALLLRYADKKSQEYALKVFPMPDGKLLPFPVTSQAIYSQWRKDGYSLGLPIDNERPAQHSGAQDSVATGSYQSFEKGRIYVVQTGTEVNQVVAVSGNALQEYLRLSCESSSLGLPISAYASPGTGWDQYDFEGGYLATTDGKTFRAFDYEQGAIAFVSDRDGNAEIYVTATNGRRQVNLTRHPSADTAPAWSPDGTRIAFVSDRQPAGIYVMNADGTGQRFLAQGSDPAWFPDGSKLVFVRSVNFEHKLMFRTETVSLFAMFVMNAVGGGQYQIPLEPLKFQGYSPGQSFRYPAVSPDGRTIAFRAAESGWPAQIYTVSLDGSGLKEIFNMSGYRTGDRPSWSPDGLSIAYERGGGGPLWVQRLGAAPVASLPSNISSSGGLDWSPDGKAIAFSGQSKDIYIILTGTNVVRKVTHGEGSNWSPSWSESYPIVSSEPVIAWGKKISSEFKSKVISIAAKLQMNVDHLMAAMAFETGGSFDPSSTNPYSGATGLIQFLPLTAQGLGTSVDALRTMTAVGQLDYVEKYLTPYRSRLSTIQDVYMAILWPKAIGQPNEFVLFARPSMEYEQNQGLDLNKDGKITKSEAAGKVIEYLARGLESQNAG